MNLLYLERVVLTYYRKAVLDSFYDIIAYALTNGLEVQGIVDMYRDWPYKGTARLFVYPNGNFGASVDS